MKFKLIQFAILLIFSISVITLVPQYEVFSTPPNEHNPNFYIDVCGYRKASGTKDPRGNSFNAPICGTDGDEYVSEKGWYYRGSGELSGDHVPAALEQVYRLNLKGAASASESSASGSLSPSLDYMHALPRKYDSWGGTGHIHLTITELDYHYLYESSIYSACMDRTAPEHEWNPTEDAEIAVNVHPTEKVVTRTSKVYAEGEYEGNGSFSGSFGGSYSESWSEKETDHLVGISYGIKASVGYGWWGTFWNPEIKLQAKEARVNGNIENAAVDMTANYDQAESTLCPYDSDNPISIPHLIE